MNMTPRLVHRSVQVTAIFWVLLFARSTSLAQESHRTWIDASGQFAIDARFVRVDQNVVVLARRDGRSVTIPIDRLSPRDKAYVDGVQNGTQTTPNRLRTSPPPAPQIAPLPPLDLPAAERVRKPGTPLEFSETIAVDLPSELPDPLEADRSPWSFAVPAVTIPMFRIESYDRCSRPLPITTSIEGTRGTSLAMSVSRRVRLSVQKSNDKLILFNLQTKKVSVALEHEGTIELLDHHNGSGRSLLLIDFKSSGQGGQLAFATGWNTGKVKIVARRPLPRGSDDHETPHLRWARWVDEDHLIALIDDSLGLWNITSGGQLYRIEGIDPRSRPAVSGGRRYVAVPFKGSVQLFDTRTGKPLGRIGVEKQLPAVSFSPYGNALAITTSRRLRVWDLPAAALSGDVLSRRSFGSRSPLWIDSDLLLSSSGILSSLHRGLPIWRYDLSSTITTAIGPHLVVWRNRPDDELSIMKLPHDGATQMMHRMDGRPESIDPESWRIPGHSTWRAGHWKDQEVKVTAASDRRR